MTGTELVERTQEVVANLEHPAVLEQIQELLPDNVSLKKFVGVAKTAVRTNADLVTADQTTLFASIIRCAQAGLYPDGHEAALVIYKGKVTFIPMIDGVAKQLAEFGWLLRTGVVRENDTFEWSEEPMSIVHRPARPGVDRGDLLYAYGIATHADGRRLQRVLDRDDIAKRRAKAQTQKVWDEFPEPMWRKSAGHAVGGDVPLSEGDRARLDRMFAAVDAEPPAALEQLYGADAVSERVDLESGEITNGTTPNLTGPATRPEGERQQAGTAAAAALAAVPVPDDDEEPEPGSPRVDDIAAAKAAGVSSTIITKGNYQGMTIAAVHDLGDEGREWFSYVLRHPKKYDDALVAAVQTFVDGTPEAQLQAA